MQVASEHNKGANVDLLNLTYVDVFFSLYRIL